MLPGEQGVCAIAHFRVQPPVDVEACDGVVQQGKVFAGQSETGEDGFAVEQGGYFVGFEAAVEQFQHLFQRVEQGTAAAEFDVGYGIRQRPSALFAEDGFDEGRPVTGYLPRLMLSASLPERLWRYPVPVRFGLCWLSFW